MFYKAGNTLRARNKIQALFLLLGGVAATVSNPPMPPTGSASMKALNLMASTYPKFWWHGWGARTYWTDEQAWFTSTYGINTLQKLFWNIINNGHLGRHISLEWIGDCGGNYSWTLNPPQTLINQITTLAQAQGYQTIWYYCQGYQYCWWNSGVQCVKANLNFSAIVSNYIRITTLASPAPAYCDEFASRPLSNYLHCFNWQGQYPWPAV